MRLGLEGKHWPESSSGWNLKRTRVMTNTDSFHHLVRETGEEGEKECFVLCVESTQVRDT